MHPVALIFGLACAGALASSVRARSGSAQVMAVLMIELWAAANMFALLDSAGFRVLRALPLLDLPIAAFAFALWYERGKTWQAFTAIFLGLRMPLHVIADVGDGVLYKHAINALFLAALVSIGWKGGADVLVGLRDGVVRLFGRRMAALACLVG